MGTDRLRFPNMTFLCTPLLFLLLVFFSSSAQMQVERLNRGLIAIRQDQGYYLSWRLLGDESYTTGFNVYRDTTRLNSEPITGPTNYIDENAPLNSTYIVKSVVNGQEQEASERARLINNTEGNNAGYFDIPLQQPSTGPHGGRYSPNDASTGDLTGDGVYEVVLMWEPNNAKDNAHRGVTDNVFLDGITLEGERLWRIDLGPNIRAGAHYTQFLVFDFDGNGRSEIMVKTAPGTRDGTGNFIGMGPAADADHSRTYRNSGGYILEGPEYLTVFDGLTGTELATTNYWPARGRVADWGDNYGNRVDRFNATVAYVDGERPSAIFQRGYYTRMTLAAWDWRDGELTRRWTFDSNDSQYRDYRGQGNHSIHVIDANNDGRHDLVTGAAVIGSDGRGMHTTRRGHGDATHCTHMIKDNPYPQIFMPYESGGNGVSLRHANNGQTIFQHQQSGDIGRGCAAELDPRRPGFHFWASDGMGLYDISGTRVGDIPNSINFVIWWDGNLSRELMNSNTITRWSVANNRGTVLLTGTGTSSINGTKSTPILQADLFGDWREEVILRRSDNALRVFTTTMPTEHRLYTFMHDPVYRVAISWQQSSYNQPPHPGSYIATDMDFPQSQPNIIYAGDPPITEVNRGSGELVEDLIVFDISNAQNWSIKNDPLPEQEPYGDRDFTFSSIPSILEDAEWISTAMNSRTNTSLQQYATFSLKRDATVYIAHSNRVEEKPRWLSEYEETDMSLTVSETEEISRTLTIYNKTFLSGDEIHLEINSNNGTNLSLMYLVLISDASTTSLSTAKKGINKGRITTRLKGKHLYIKAHVSASDRKPKISLYDISGRTINTLDIDQVGSTLSISVPRLSSGVYLINIAGKKQSIVIGR
ncbi:T9SS type A sorting domain-containing protein [Chitinispirillales bacterium ANBcel5]|uniref:rhamnogalacturonan lyase family protein n=1 Tax=Cellulosispirillum alkaliphilum TaxID=3039283 RepID=UPI002A58AB08|nr:T9SS type A sorting domain-containing protein [Chitinispirillales bacterium ANBcel5]